MEQKKINIGIIGHCDKSKSNLTNIIRMINEKYTEVEIVEIKPSEEIRGQEFTHIFIDDIPIPELPEPVTYDDYQPRNGRRRGQRRFQNKDKYYGK